MKIEILTSPGCAKCVLAEKRIREVVERTGKDLPNVQVSLVDITEKPEMAERYMLFSTPGIVIDGELAFVGIPKEEELRLRIQGQI